MKNGTVQKVIAVTIVFFLRALVLINADNIRGKMVEVSRIGNGSGPSASLSLRLEETWGIVLEKDKDLLRGIEFLIDLPEQVELFAGTYAVFVYGGVSPLPEKNRPDYQGALLFLKPIEGGKRFFIQLPFETLAGFGTIPDTYVHRPPLVPAGFPLIFTIMPVMKGLPDRAAQAVFGVQVRPLFKNLGKLILSFTSNEGPVPSERTRIFIDDRGIPYGEEGVNVEPGIRRIRVETEGYSPFLSTVGIDRGKISRVEAYFHKSESLIRINAPVGTRTFLNGKFVELDKKEISLEPGEHTLSFKLGDYQLSKKFFVEPGKSYSISLFLDILINED